MKNTLAIIISVSLLVMSLTGCMSDKEWYLRNKQLSNQAEWQKNSVYEAVSLEGPVTIEVKEQGKVVVKAPNQPFQEVSIPDGIKSQEQLIAHLIDIGAISVLGWKALDKASSSKTTNTTVYKGE